MRVITQTVTVPTPESDDGQSVDAWLEEVVRENYRALFAYAYSLTKNKADAADLTQQTTVILATRWKEIHDPSRVRPWLFTCLYREFVRLWKRNARHVPLDESHMDEPSGDVQAQEQAHDCRSVVRAIHSLEEPHRSVLALHYLDELSYKEIAEVLQIPTGTVMSRLSRAKDVIRRTLFSAS